MKAKVFLAVLLVLFVAACGYQAGQIQVEEQGYVKFTGVWENAEVQFDNSPVIVLAYKDVAVGTGDVDHSNEAELTTRVAPAMTYALSPGKHRLKVVRDGQLVVNRILYVGDQSTMEVRIP